MLAPPKVTPPTIVPLVVRKPASIAPAPDSAMPPELAPRTTSPLFAVAFRVPVMPIVPALRKIAGAAPGPPPVIDTTPATNRLPVSDTFRIDPPTAKLPRVAIVLAPTRVALPAIVPRLTRVPAVIEPVSLIPPAPAPNASKLVASIAPEMPIVPAVSATVAALTGPPTERLPVSTRVKLSALIVPSAAIVFVPDRVAPPVMVPVPIPVLVRVAAVIPPDSVIPPVLAFSASRVVAFRLPGMPIVPAVRKMFGADTTPATDRLPVSTKVKLPPVTGRVPSTPMVLPPVSVSPPTMVPMLARVPAVIEPVSLTPPELAPRARRVLAFSLPAMAMVPALNENVAPESTPATERLPVSTRVKASALIVPRVAIVFVPVRVAPPVMVPRLTRVGAVIEPDSVMPPEPAPRASAVVASMKPGMAIVPAFSAMLGPVTTPATERLPVSVRVNPPPLTAIVPSTPIVLEPARVAPPTMVPVPVPLLVRVGALITPLPVSATPPPETPSASTVPAVRVLVSEIVPASSAMFCAETWPLISTLPVSFRIRLPPVTSSWPMPAMVLAPARVAPPVMPDELCRNPVSIAPPPVSVIPPALAERSAPFGALKVPVMPIVPACSTIVCAETVPATARLPLSVRTKPLVPVTVKAPSVAIVLVLPSDTVSPAPPALCRVPAIILPKLSSAMVPPAVRSTRAPVLPRTALLAIVMPPAPLFRSIVGAVTSALFCKRMPLLPESIDRVVPAPMLPLTKMPPAPAVLIATLPGAVSVPATVRLPLSTRLKPALPTATPAIVPIALVPPSVTPPAMVPMPARVPAVIAPVSETPPALAPSARAVAAFTNPPIPMVPAFSTTLAIVTVPATPRLPVIRLIVLPFGTSVNGPATRVVAPLAAIRPSRV